MATSSSQAKRDYYAVLGIDRTATPENVKQAYHQLALKWHPDRNPAPEATDKFREIAEAYAVLSDPAKRQAYDTTGHAGVSERWSMEDIFRDFDFGDFFGARFADLGGIFGDLFGGHPKRPRAKPRGADLRHDITLTLDDAAKGGDRTIHLTRSERCTTCNGSGAKPGTQPLTCAECGGSGEKQHVRTDGAMRIVTLTGCARCHGTGMIIETPCAECQGTAIKSSSHAIKVHIPAGIHDGMLLRLVAQGESAPEGGSPGDLLIRIHVQPHPSLERHGDDLYATTPLSFPEAVLGTKINVSCLSGETVRVTVPPGVQYGTVLRVRGKGMPRLNSKGKGDLFVVIEFRTPTDLTPLQRELLKEFAKLEAEKKDTFRNVKAGCA